MGLKQDQIASQCSLPPLPLFPPPVFSLEGLQKNCDPFADERESRITREADI